VSTLVFAALAALGAFYMGRLGERARSAHQQFSSYRSRTGSSFREWLKDSTLAFMIALGVVLLVLSSFIKEP
jgi:hypothetical protein